MGHSMVQVHVLIKKHSQVGKIISLQAPDCRDEKQELRNFALK